MVGYERVVDVLSAYSEHCSFQWSHIHTITTTFFLFFPFYFFFLPLWYNKVWKNNRETCSPHSLKHCGAIMEDRNIPAQHDATRKSLKCELLLWGPFLYYSTNLTDVNSGPSHRKMTALKQLLQAQAIGHSTAVGWLPYSYGGEKGWSQSGEHEMQWKEWKKESNLKYTRNKPILHIYESVHMPYEWRQVSDSVKLTSVWWQQYWKCFSHC